MRIRAVWAWVVVSVVLGGNSVWCKKSRVWRDDDGAYRDLVIAIHPSFAPRNCTKFFENLKEALGAFSLHLWRATHGHVYLGDVGVVVPPSLSLACSVAPSTRATWQKWTTADMLVTPGGPTPEWAWGVEGSIGVGVSQPEGCGRPGNHISLDPDVLMELDSHEMKTLGRSLVGSWARYRWGVFEERGYLSHPRYPSIHTMDDVPTPTTCTTTPTKGHWEPRKGSGECNNTEELTSCEWIPDTSSHVNTSLMYRADLPEMWGFCDSTNHDPDAPTPHNLLCGTNSVWDIMNRHLDFSKKPIHHKKEENQSIVSDTVIKNVVKVQFNNASDLDDGDVNVTSIEIFGSENNSSFGSDNETLSLEIVNTTDTLFLDDLRNHLTEKLFSLPEENNTALPIVEQPVDQSQKKIRKRDTTIKTERSSAPVRPSLVTAHIATSTTPPLVAAVKQEVELPENIEGIISFQDLRRFEEIMQGRFQEKKNITSPASSRLPNPPELKLLSTAPKAVVLALDLSDHAVNQVSMDDLRGGILRWLWGLGEDVKVGVVAAYNNASYPLTLGPLLPAPTTAAELEDKLTLLPSADEVEDGVYGGKYCLECVLTEAVKMLEGGGVETGAGVLLLAACSPTVPSSAVEIVEAANLFIHTIALCPIANPVFDQLAQSGGSWVLPGLSIKPTDPEIENKNEHKAALSLTAATKAAMSMPGSPTLVRVGSSVVQVTQRGVESAGPYSTLTSRFSLPGAEEQLLIVITTQYQAKVIEVADISGRKIDVIRDTNQRFWAVIDKEVGGEVTYTLKFLAGSIIFPFSVVMDVYERKWNKVGVEIELHTNNDNHVPLEPGSHPLVVWAKVMQDGQPVVGAKVMLTVSHLSQDGSTDMTLQLLDNGNTEPDIRGHDGVYTRYVTWLPGEGRYALSASASDNQGAASVLAPRRRDGRVVPVSAGQFTVTSAVASVTVLRVTSDDLTPPSRITDLTVISVHDTTVNLTWSAPGGDLDQGSAWLYELKMYTERSALSEEKFNTSTISVYCITDDLRAPTRTPSNYGTPQHCLTELPFTNLRWYFAIRAVDSANNTGKISNVVSAFVPDPPTTPPPTLMASDPTANIQTVLMSTITSANPRDSQIAGNGTSLDQSKNVMHDWRVWVAVGVGGIILTAGVVMVCICCCKRSQASEEKDPDRPIYKIYVNNAYIQEEDGEIKVVSNGKLVDDKEPSQVQEWVNSLSKFGSTTEFVGDTGTATATEAPLVECRPRASMKYSSPVRFGVLTNGSIMRETCASSSSTSSSKPSDDPAHEDFKYRDLSETTSNSTTDGGASASSTDVPPPPPPPIIDNSSVAAVTVKSNSFSMPPPPPPSQFHQQPLGIPGPTVISIHPVRNTIHPNGYSSDEEGGFRPRTVPGPGPRRYLPTHFSSFRYLPPPPEYRSAAAGVATATGSIHYPHHTISRATATLPHGTVRSVKKRRHISFV